MASTRRRQGSRYWFACYTLPDGTRRQRSTKTTDRKEAQKLADTFEQATKRQLTARQAQRIISDIFQRVTGDSLPSTSIRSYFESWLARKELETTASTFKFYDSKVRRFLDWFGERSAREMFGLDTSDLLAFRSNEAERVSPSTVNHSIKLLRMILNDAKRDGIIADNPADSVKMMKRSGQKSPRRPFTISEVKQLLAVANSEWRSLIIFGLYTGQRLGDLARLTWANVDLQQDEIRLLTSKTGRRQIIPLAPTLRQHIESLPAGDDPVQPIHPRAFNSVTRSGKVGMLSRQFHELMAKAGLVAKKKHRKTAESKGRDGRRPVSEISFHALRHTATSLMKNAGISAPIVQDIIGHESAAISASYTHIDNASKRAALSAMPDVLDHWVGTRK